jgi:GR25 family glycosyltransferase involved in LPS biosynthesis
MPVCRYINLDAASARRASLEASFAAADPRGWRLERFPALGPGHKGLSGPISPAAQGCFHSHGEALAASLSDDEPVMIVEDDAVFAPDTFAAIDDLLAQPADWDLLLTEAAILDAALMVNLARARNALAAKGQAGVRDLKDRPFAGASSYVVRGAAKRKVAEALAAGDLSRPVDLYLRDLSHAGRLKIAVAVPFLTSLAPAAAASQIGADDPAWDRPTYLFRRYMFAGRDLAALAPEADALLAEAEPEGRVLAAVIAAITSPGFRGRRR